MDVAARVIVSTTPAIPRIRACMCVWREGRGVKQCGEVVALMEAVVAVVRYQKVAQHKKRTRAHDARGWKDRPPCDGGHIDEHERRQTMEGGGESMKGWCNTAKPRAIALCRGLSAKTMVKHSRAGN